jgi:eukaryotic-like serine/threonine-protein kinase
VAVGILVATEEPPSADGVMRVLKRGEAVTLVGETGGPRYHRWVVGTGTSSLVQDGGNFLVFTAGSGMLELVPDCQSARYRLSAEYQVADSTDRSSFAGVYFAHRSDALGAGVAAHRVVIVRFSDDLITNRPSFGDNDAVQVQDAVIHPWEEEAFRFFPFPVAKLWVKEHKGFGVRPWRKVVATVGPEAVRVEWREGGVMRPVAPQGREEIPGGAFDGATAQHREALKTNRPDLDPGRLVPHDPRGGVGLYVHNARVFFRNVVLEPLPR